MDSLYVVLVATIVLTYAALMVLKPVSSFAGLHDMPDQRKNHDSPVPAVGGLAVFLGLSISSNLYLSSYPQIQTFFMAALMCVLLGVADDRDGLSPKVKLLSQMFITLYVCLFSPQSISSLGNLLGSGELYLDGWGYIVTVLAVVGAINAYNMFDGLDGLVGGVSLITLAAIAFLCLRAGFYLEVTLSLSLAVALIPYLLMNLTVPPFKKKVFLGDAGAMLIGFSVVWLLISGSQHPNIAFAPATALWLIGLPLMDMVCVMTLRFCSGVSPLMADHRHLHHRLQRAGFTKKQTLIVICFASFAMVLTGTLFMLFNVTEKNQFYSFLLVFAIYFVASGYSSKYSRKLK